MEFVELPIAHQHIWSAQVFFSWIPVTLGKSRQFFWTPRVPVISQIGASHKPLFGFFIEVDSKSKLTIKNLSACLE